MSIHNRIRSHLLSCIDLTPVGDKAESEESLRSSEWSMEFETLMRNRLLMGRFRYGRLDRTTNTGYDRIGSMISRLKAYRISGNTENLVDIASLALMEFVHGDHPDKHFSAVDDGEHVALLK